MCFKWLETHFYRSMPSTGRTYTSRRKHFWVQQYVSQIELQCCIPRRWGGVRYACMLSSLSYRSPKLTTVLQYWGYLFASSCTWRFWIIDVCRRFSHVNYTLTDVPGGDPKDIIYTGGFAMTFKVSPQSEFNHTLTLKPSIVIYYTSPKYKTNTNHTPITLVAKENPAVTFRIPASWSACLLWKHDPWSNLKQIPEIQLLPYFPSTLWE